MGDNIPPSPSTTPKRPKRKYDKTKLPTPPPDPTEKVDDREDFLAYLDSLQKSNIYMRSTSTFAPVIATEDAFDHLEKLYKIMEQMLELREQNARLHRRVRDLEHFNNLEKMHRELNVERECPELEKDTAFAETILESILQEAKPKKISTSSRLRHSISRKQRNRSGSVSVDMEQQKPEQNVDRRASTCIDSRVKPSKVSKWTKVKAAFKWEKASPTVSDTKSQDSGIGGIAPVEVARYLRVPSMGGCEDGHSPADSGAAEISTPGTLSTASSNEDFHRNDLRSPCDHFGSSDDEHSHISHSKEGSQKSNKSHKTPWAKMKDIIHTRNSFKKKHRLSAQSDDIQIDVELCSDNEEVFEEQEQRSKVTTPVCSNIYKRLDSSEVPQEIIERYHQVVAEDGSTDIKKISKWSRVKKAFLAPNDINQNINLSQPTKEILRTDDETKSVHVEIQHNYKQLQKKLSLEFQEKLTEWERMKQNSPGTSNPSSSCGFVEDRDPAFMKKMEEWQKMKSQPQTRNRANMQLTSEENLPPEFRKKLQEWEKIRKNSNKETGTTKKKIAEVPRWKSLSTHKRETSPTFEYPTLSYDFKKKLEEWKQIKAGINVEEASKKVKDVSKTSSPRLSRKNSSKKKKETHEKELQWFEKELSKIEKEKQRLEREKQKYLEREERLAKLRSSIIGGYKKEILVHTPSGFHRFEGISKKFTQKLYEWEKAQGIGPESSTFALLNSSLISDTTYPKKANGNNTSLMRSKSADSIAISALNLACPLISQPSSLSLNDMDDLEKECLAESKSSSMHFIQSHETISEPEAIIVEVEDIVEETASPLRPFTEKTQQPVYQRQELKAMCEGEIGVAPKIRRSESTRAQNNYNLIEDIFNILKSFTENELEIQKTQHFIVDTIKNKRTNANILRLQSLDETQKHISPHLHDKVTKLQEANSNLLTNLTKEDNSSSVVDILETIQDLSSEIMHLSEKLELEVNNRNIFDNFHEGGATSLSPILEIIKDIRSKMLELRRKLSYLCAASDTTAPGKKGSKRKIRKTVSDESQKEPSDETKCDLDINNRDGRLYIKSNNSNIQSQGAIKKRIRYRQNRKENNKSFIDSDEDEEGVEIRKNNHKKLTRTRSVSEGSNTTIKAEDDKQVILVNEDIIKKVVVPTKTNYLIIEDNVPKPPDSPVTVFVKTTRKLFTPIVESGVSDKKLGKEEDSASKIDAVFDFTSGEKNEHKVDVKNENEDQHKENSNNVNTVKPSASPLFHLPPLPASPTVQRKVTKDISPSIRLMLAKYNQKLSEQDIAAISGGSSGSVSPAWRSPKSERRVVKIQTEKYQESLNKLSPLLNERREVHKSASTSYIHESNRTNSYLRKQSVESNSINNSRNDDKNNITKSSSTSIILENMKSLNLTMKPSIKDNEWKRDSTSSDIRLKKIQKAKEDFLNSTPSSAPPQISSEEIKYPTRNRLSQISVESESSYESACTGALIKSASAGMINIDADTYKQFNPEIHGGGYVSLPRCTKKQKEGLLGGKFAFSNIASKFRKVKMRKGKDKDKMNVVPILCRQSLVVDINESKVNKSAKSMEDVSHTEKCSSWIKRTKLFKK